MGTLTFIFIFNVSGFGIVLVIGFLQTGSVVCDTGFTAEFWILVINPMLGFMFIATHSLHGQVLQRIMDKVNKVSIMS